jgi:hypothetical protein
MNFVVIRRLSGTLVAAGAVAFGFAPSASASTVAAADALDRSCTDGKRSGSSVGAENVAVDGVSFVQAHLSDAEGNWDLAVIDEQGRVVAGAAQASGDEIAEGYAIEAGELRVQACRRTGSDDQATLEIETNAFSGSAQRTQLLRVATPTEKDVDRLVDSGYDLTENGGPGFIDVVAYGPAQAAMLNELGFDFEVINPDLAAQSIHDRATERRLAARGVQSTLPSGRTDTYRQLADYSQELQKLAGENPKLVRYFTLKNETYSGRKVEAIEVGPKLGKKDGRPTFLMTGVHHAREWPSSEHTIEFAYDLINGWNDGKKQIRKLMRRTRVVFVPVVNPDGFNLSRTAGEALGAAGGRDAPAGEEIANLLIAGEYHRKNCRYVKSSNLDGGDCNQVVAGDNGIFHFGVDPNRNYGGFWGGPGASTGEEAPFFDLAADYRGPAPFSEPETQNIRKLVARRHVTTLITNHTFSNLVLRPPGLQSQGKPRDDKVLNKLASAMAAENGYKNQRGYQLYDTSGTTEDWSYNATSGFGYTFEIGPDAFHPSYQSVADEYRGDTDVAGDGNGNRAAFRAALRSTQNPNRHSLIKGRAPKGAFLTLNKRFKTPTSPVLDGSGEEGDVIKLPERLKSNLQVGKNGRFRWHVNPSTRPIADPRYGKEGKTRPGKPSDPIAFNGPDGLVIPCGDADSEDPSCFSDHPFKVPGGKGIDNGTATIEVSWGTPATDWDMKVFRDTDRDGTSIGEEGPVGASADGPTTSESVEIVRPGLRKGPYVVRMTSFVGIEPFNGTITFGKTQKDASVAQRIEKYTLLCRKKRNGKVLSRTNIAVDIGERVGVNLRKVC